MHIILIPPYFEAEGAHMHNRILAKVLEVHIRILDPASQILDPRLRSWTQDPRLNILSESRVLGFRIPGYQIASTIKNAESKIQYPGYRRRLPEESCI